MAEIINLRQARKQRDRQEKESRAAANRVRFGRTKAERRQARDEEARKARDLDGKRREEGDPLFPGDGEDDDPPPTVG